MSKQPKCECGATVSLYFSERLDCYVCPDCQEKSIQELMLARELMEPVHLRAYFAGQAFKALTLAWTMPTGGSEADIHIPKDKVWATIAAAALNGADAMLAKLKG